MPLPRPLLTVLLAAAVLPVSSAVAATPAADADLHCGRLFDARSGKLLGPHTVQVQAGRIVAVSPGLPSTTGSGARLASSTPRSASTSAMTLRTCCAEMRCSSSTAPNSNNRLTSTINLRGTPSL